LTTNRITINANDPTQNPLYNPADPNGSKTAARLFLANWFAVFPNINTAVLGTPKQTATGMSPDFHLPHTIEATIGFTHDFANKIGIRADYIYSHGYDVVLQRNINITQDANGNWVTIDPRFTAINMYQNLGWIKYNALVSRVEYRGNKLRLGLSYTLAKGTSDSTATGVGGGAATNPLNLSIDEGPTNEDRRHVLVSDFSYVFPLDFQVSGIARYQSALPYSATNSNIVYARPLPRNSLRGDAESNLDLRVGKKFKVGHYSATFFWEMFNITNTVNYIQFQGNQLSTSYQKPQGALPMRRQQVGMRFDF
jgi:hypothetical protein